MIIQRHSLIHKAIIPSLEVVQLHICILPLDTHHSSERPTNTIPVMDIGLYIY